MENDAVKRPYRLLPLSPYRAVTGRTFSVKSYKRKSKFGAGSLQNIICSVVGIFGIWVSHSSACLGRKHYQICGRLSLGKASCWEKRVPDLSELTVQLIKGCPEQSCPLNHIKICKSDLVTQGLQFLKLFLWCLINL